MALHSRLHRLALLSGLSLVAIAGPAAAAVPTMTSITPLTGSREDTATSIPYATLLANSNAQDADGDAIEFVVKSIPSGTLQRGGSTVNVGDTLRSGQTWTWTPAANANGAIGAIGLRALAGGEESASTVTLTINVAAVNDAPSFTSGGDRTVDEDSSPAPAAWATAISAGPSDESGQVLAFVVTGTTNPSLFETLPAISPSGVLSFKPAANEYGSSTVSVKLTDTGGTANGGVNESPVVNFTITVNPVPDSPILGGAIGDTEGGTVYGTIANPLPDSETSEGAGTRAFTVFESLTVTDYDDKTSSPDLQTVTVTVSKTADLYGTFSLPGSTKTGTTNDWVYTLPAARPATAQSQLRAATFQPTPNAQPVADYDFPVKVEVRDSTSRTATPANGPLHVRSVNDAPLVSATLALSSTPDSGEISPFRLSVSDVDPGESFSVTVTETSATARGTLVLPSNPITGSAAGVASSVSSIRYQPSPQTANVTATFAVSVTDVHPGGTTGTPDPKPLSLTITFSNDPPQISGITTELIRTTDDPAAPAVFPFSTVTIADADPGQQLTITLSLDDPAKGGFISDDFDALQQITGTAAEVTAKLRNVSFRPTSGRIPVNDSETVTLTILVNDGTITRGNGNTRIEVTSVNGAPAVLWNKGPSNSAGNFPAGSSPALVDPSPSAMPFELVTLSDDSEIVLTVSLDNPAKGTLQNLGGFAETAAGSGTYQMTGDPAAVQAALQAMVFVPSGSFQFPPNQPGRTDFTLAATDSALNVTTRVLPIVLVSDTRNFLVTSPLDDASLPGTLRHALSHAKANDVITFALPAYPATIRLGKANGPLVLEDHLTLRGPGADLLTISGDSNANGVTDAGDTQILRVFANVRVKGVRLARGFAATGGAIYVGRLAPETPAGVLTLQDCAIADCVASQWGGAVDVVEGRVSAERCSFENNRVDVSSGLGGGAVSLYTSEACAFVNSTFSANTQGSPTGYGGGAIYAENHTASVLFPVEVKHCTFGGNSDAAGKGSSIHSNVSNTRVILTNSIFADFTNRNLQVAGAGEIVSKGGNLSTDNTSTTRIQGGVPQQVHLLSHPSDQRAVDPKLQPIAMLEGQARGFRLMADSPAVGAGVAGAAAVDQRGVIRSGGVDSGAVDAEALGKLVIHEIFASQGSADPQFIEFFNPRDQAAVDLSGFEVWIDGLQRHVFGAGHVIQPGYGILLADATPVPAPGPKTPVVLPSVSATGPDLELAPRGRIELRMPTPDGLRTVESADYVGIIVNPFTPADSFDYDLDSLTLAPQFKGAAFVPHSLVLPPPNGGVSMSHTGARSSPGADTGNTPFGEPNAYPFAVADQFEITEDEPGLFDVLANDLDADGSDELFVVDLNPTTSSVPPTTGRATLTTGGGATVTVTPAGTPLRGTAIGFDPRTAYNSLPAGARVTDTFAYSILDVGGGAVAGYADGGTGKTVVTAPAHRLSDGDLITLSGAGPAGYNGTFAVADVDEETFTIPVAFTVDPDPVDRGRWLAAVPRVDSARSETLVQVSILGRNDPPAPLADHVATDEDSVLRVFADPTHAGSGTPLDTDAAYPAPRRVSATALLANDGDPDTSDQPSTKLRVVGVCQASDIGSFDGIAGSSPVTVNAPGHGLATGQRVLVSGYGGHPSYNGYHFVTVTGPDRFTIPVTFVDDLAPKGRWTILEDAGRLSTTSVHGAAVTLEIRADAKKTNIVFNPRSSEFLNGLADGESATDSFFYAVQDPAGAVSLARIEVAVAGVNDAPVPADDPPGLGALQPLLAGGGSLTDLAGDSEVLYVRPGTMGTVDATLVPPGTAAADAAVVTGLPWTHEDAALALASAGLLGNDGDVDRSDVLRLEVGAGQELSREGAAVRLSSDGSTLTYDPTAAPRLQSLAFKERVVDVVTLTVFDGLARVETRLAVLVEGRNDTPVASNAAFTTHEKQVLPVPPPVMIGYGLEIDQDTRLPDNHRFLLPESQVPTTVFGALVDVGLELAEGSVDAFAAGAPGTTLVRSAGHRLATGEELILPASGPLTGQYPVTRVDADTLSIPVAWDPAFSTLGGGWRVVRSTLTYDPTGSVFSGPVGGPSFTLQGLAEGQSYVDSHTYTLLDGSFLFANDDIFRIEADRSDIELKVLTNDTRLDGVSTLHRIIAVGPPSAGGTVVMNGDSSLRYTPETGFVGDEFFTYTIEDDLGNRDSALVTARVTVDRLNGNLRANPDAFTVAAGQSPLLAVLANDSIIPASGDPLTLVSVVRAPDAGGTATIESGRIRYTPAASPPSYPYVETFDYTMSGGGSATAVATVTVRVEDRTGTLNVRADSFSVPGGVVGAVLNVLENDNILPGTGEALEIVAVTDPANGSVSITDGIGLAYTPDAGFLGTDTFEYTAADGFGGTGTATVSVGVGFLTTNTDFFSVPFDDPGKTGDDGATALDVLANDNVLQAAGGILTIVGVTPTNPALGAMSIAGGSELRFDPAPGASGQQQFTYTVADAGGRQADGTVTVVVIAGGIHASSDFFTVQTESEGNVLAVLPNDLRISDLPGELSIASVGTGPNAPDQGGTVEISADFKSLVYTPAAGFSGTESFTYTVTDGDGSDTARVSVTVTGGALVAAPDEFLVYLGSPATRLDVLQNDRVIPDGGQALVVTATGPDPGNASNPTVRGTLEPIEDGAALLYTPAPENQGSYEETFTYEISAGGTERSEARIRIQVLDRVGVRDLETNHDVFAVRSDSGGTPLPVLANDSVLPASAGGWTITEVTVPTPNACSPFLTSDFTDPAVLASTLAGGADLLSQYLWARFPAAERAVLENPASGELDLRVALVLSLNAVAEGGSSIHEATRFAGIVLRPETQALLDQGASGEQLVVLNRLLLEDAYPSGIRAASGGGAVQIAGSNLIYVPQPGFVGGVRFTYRVSDGLGGTGFAEVTVKVGDVSVSDDAYTVVAGGGPVDLDVTANDGVLRTAFPAEPDPAQADFTLSVVRGVEVSPPAAGGASVSGGVVRFTPDAGFAGHATLTYWVEDDAGCPYPGTAVVDVRAPGGDRDTATVSFTVTGVNDAPMLWDAGSSATDDKTGIHPFAGATVVEWDDQRQQVVTLTVRYPEDRGVLQGDFTRIAPGVIRFSGTAAQVTAALRALVYVPVENRIPVGTTEDTRFRAELDDGAVASPVVVDTAVTTVTPVNEPPVLTGTIAGQRMYQYSSIRPFAGVDIRDVDDLGLQRQTVTLTLDNPAKGILSNLGGFVEQPAGSRTYVMSGSPGAVASAMRNLVFTPTPADRVTPTSPETASFRVSVHDGFAAAVVDSSTTIIVLHGQVDKLLPLAAGGADISQVSADFGDSVAVDGDTLVVGSPLRDTPGIDAGRVFVYERNAGLGAPWGQVVELIGADTAAGDRFGTAVDLSGDFLVVGAPGADPGVGNIGAAYIFRRDAANPNAWSQVGKLVPPVNNGAGVGNDAFGTAVAVDGDTILVGAPNGNLPGAPRSGRVFAFRHVAGSWTHTQTLVAAQNNATGVSGDSEWFGQALDLDGDTAVIGSPGANRTATVAEVNYGAAYVFSRPGPGGSWSEVRRIDEFDSPDGSPYSGFGYAVDLDGDRLAIGIHSDNAAAGFKPGGARLYGRNTTGADRWGLVQKFAPVSGAPSIFFGRSVALSGDLLLVGSPGADEGSTDPRGAADLFRRTPGASPEWVAIDRFRPGNAGANDRFGDGIAIDGFTAAIGARSDGVNNLGAALAGSARVYQFQYDLGPRLAMPLADVVVDEGQPFSLTVPAETFVDPIYDALVIGVQLADGSPLPVDGWLGFDPLTATFSGTPSASERRDYELVLFAANPLGTRTLSNAFRIEVASTMPAGLQEAYDQWILTQFSQGTVADAGLEATVWGMDADPDKDGIRNLFELMFGFSATVRDADPLEFVDLPGDPFSLTFPLSDEFPEQHLAVEWGTDLAAWSRTGVVITFAPAGPGMRQATAVVTPTGTPTRAFARVTTTP